MHMCMYILKVDKSVILNVLVMFAVHVITDFCLFLCFISLLHCFHEKAINCTVHVCTVHLFWLTEVSR